LFFQNLGLFFSHCGTEVKAGTHEWTEKNPLSVCRVDSIRKHLVFLLGPLQPFSPIQNNKKRLNFICICPPFCFERLKDVLVGGAVSLLFFTLVFFSTPFLFSLNWDSWRGCDLCLVFYEPEGCNNSSDNNNKEPVVGLFAIKRVMSQMQIAHPVPCFMILKPLHSKRKSIMHN